MNAAAALVVAKAPVAGRVKTRLGAHVGDATAARVAAAALHDTLDACEDAFGEGACYLALDGDLLDAVDGSVLDRRLRSWTVFPQRGDGFAARLAHAHTDAAARSGWHVVQVGMDTPHATPGRLRQVADLLGGVDAVLGPAPDGGWWVLGLARADLAAALHDVPMSTAHTCRDTRRALHDAGATVRTVAPLRDVDTRDDAEAVARVAPGTRFARAWQRSEHRGGVR